MESFSVELKRVFSLWALRGRHGASSPPTDGVIVSFGAVSVLLWLVLDRLRYGRDAEFLPFAAPELTWSVAPALTAAWLASRLCRPQVQFRSVLFLFVVLAPIVIACAFLLEKEGAPVLHVAAIVGVTAYVIVYLASGLRTLTSRPQIPATIAVLGIAALFVAFNSHIYFSPTLWTERAEEQPKTAARWSNAEELLISQPARIDALVTRVTPPAANKTGVYFVGFAGVGRQKVFSEEIKLAAQRIADRYGSSDRTLLLLNDQRDVNSYPLATSAGLKLALKGIASRMNLDRDVLFLALSSHGSAEPALSVSNGSLPLRDLTGTDLAAALQESGIKWRVIVVSACHAGAFISALRNDNTLILTAAAADRTSFGCSDDRDLTYFGEAFYRDALPKSASLREAFGRATADIAAREQREGIKASNPQAFFGPAMDRKLAEIESRNQGPLH